MRLNGFTAISLFLSLLSMAHGRPIEQKYFSRWIQLARSMDAVIKNPSADNVTINIVSGNETKENEEPVIITTESTTTITTTSTTELSTTTVTAASEHSVMLDNISIIDKLIDDIKESLLLDDENDENDDDSSLLVNPESANGSAGDIFSDIAVSLLADSIAPILSTFTPSIGNFVKTFLSDISSDVLSEVANKTMDLLTQGKMAGVLKSPNFEAHPIFIPNFGSYLMLTNTGVFNPAKVEKGEESNEEKTASKLPNLPKNMQTFFLGQVYLLPLSKNPEVLSKSHSNLDDAEEEELKRAVQMTVGSTASVGKIRKRLIMHWLKKIKNEIKTIH